MYMGLARGPKKIIKVPSFVGLHFVYGLQEMRIYDFEMAFPLQIF